MSPQQTARSLLRTLARLDWEDDEARAQVAEALGGYPEPYVVNTLIQLVRLDGQYHPEVAEAARKALVQIGEPAARALIRRIRREAGFAATILASFPADQVVGLLISALQDQNSQVRREAAWTLGLLGDSRAVTPLLTALGDPESNVRHHAAVALGQLRDSRATASLFQVTTDDVHIGTRRAAAAALGQIGDEAAIAHLQYLLGSDDARLGRVARVALTALSERGRAVLEVTLADQAVPRRARRQAALAFAALGDGRMGTMLHAMLADTGEALVLRGDAAEMLGELGDPGALGVLSIIAMDAAEDLTVRIRAIKGLRQLGHERATAQLTGLLRDANRYIRAEAAEALGQAGGPGALEPLVAALHDGDFIVQWAAAEALGQLGDSRAVEPLLLVLNRDADSASYLISTIARALGRLGDGRAIEPLVARLDDPTGSIAKALVQIGGPEALAALTGALRDHRPLARTQAIMALSGIGGDTAIDTIIDQLRKEQDEWVLERTAERLGRLGDERALTALEWRQQHDPRPQVKAAMSRAIRRINRQLNRAPTTRP